MTFGLKAPDDCPTASVPALSEVADVTRIVAATFTLTHVFDDEPGGPGAGCWPLFVGCGHVMNVFVRVQVTAPFAVAVPEQFGSGLVGAYLPVWAASACSVTL